MATMIEVRVPDLGDFSDVDVVEVLVAAGDQVDADDSLITLETDKASMEVPSPIAGVVRDLAVAVGSKVSAGDLILTLGFGKGGEEERPVGEPPAADPKETEGTKTVDDPEAGALEPKPAAPPPDAPSSPAADLYDFDVLVLGSGPGGYSAAFRAADLGKKTVLIERYATLGGVCLNVGCIPSKALLHAARVIEEASFFNEHGVVFGAPRIELAKLRAWKNGVVGRLTGGLDQMAKRRKVEVIAGEGRFVDPHRLELQTKAGARTVSFESAIIAAGSRAASIPGLPYDDSRIMDSTGALELEDVPKRLLVIGGGIIGLELATVYDALGSTVTVVELLDRLLTGCDRDLVRPLRKRVEKRYKSILLSTGVESIKAQKRGLKVSFAGDSAPPDEVFDRVLMAVGRRPNGDRIGAEAAGVQVDDRGFIPVDVQQRTNVEHVFAIGDIAGDPMLAHKATHEGHVAAEVIAGLRSGFEARVIPNVAYTDPEIAWVGVTEDEAKADGIDYGKGVFPWAASGRALTIGRDDGMTKLLFDKTTGRLIGAGIVGPNAGDLIAEAALAIEMNSDAVDLALTIHAHPTLSETIGLAAEAYEGTITDLYVPKRR